MVSCFLSAFFSHPLFGHMSYNSVLYSCLALRLSYTCLLTFSVITTHCAFAWLISLISFSSQPKYHFLRKTFSDPPVQMRCICYTFMVPCPWSTVSYNRTMCIQHMTEYLTQSNLTWSDKCKCTCWVREQCEYLGGF